MQIIKSLTKLLIFICPAFATAQSTFLNQGSKDIHFVDRMEIKQQRNTHLNFSALQPFNRRYIVQQAEFIDSARLGYIDTLTGRDKYPEWMDQGLTPVDEYDLHSFLMNNTEWVTVPREDFMSKRPVLKTFYKTKPNFLEVRNRDFFLALNPVLQFNAGYETGTKNQSVYLNSRGVTLRGMIGRKVGFSSSIIENQERGPQFFQQQVASFRAVPGVGFYKPFKTSGVDYFDARGYITFNAAKAIDIQFGYDKNFIGNGYRSLFLSDWGNSNLFLKINTRIWKINYQNLFMELMPQFKKVGDTLLDRKYAAMHHLSMNVTKWLNIGLFEGVIFGRKNRFDFQYLNPIIFYRHIEGTVGSPDNALAGFDFKANIAHRAQLYGQLLLDEFILSEIKNNPTSWVNKWGIQVGVKYLDAFGVRNLDIQLETNRVRPFTYSHNDTISNYTHYNQPLAHPLGANFQEFIGIIRYQPAPKWYVYLQAIYYYQGLDSAGKNFGGNIFRDYTTRSMNDGFKIGSGNKATCLNGLLQVSYELKENLFLELMGQYRNYKIKNNPVAITSTMITAGIRLNMFNRRYDY
ncbi:MAG: capsule assembly Wzi family protein [Ferruginibacter sp.]